MKTTRFEHFQSWFVWILLIVMVSYALYPPVLDLSLRGPDFPTQVLICFLYVGMVVVISHLLIRFFSDAENRQRQRCRALALYCLYLEDTITDLINERPLDDSDEE